MYEDDGEDQEEHDEGPDERDADLGWGGPELPPGPTLGQRLRQGAFVAVILLLLSAILFPLIITATR